MGRLITLVAMLLLAAGAVPAPVAAGRESAGEFTIGATDGRGVVTRGIGRGLLLKAMLREIS